MCCLAQQLPRAAAELPHIPFQQIVRATEWVDEREIRGMED